MGGHGGIRDKRYFVLRVYGSQILVVSFGQLLEILKTIRSRDRRQEQIEAFFSATRREFPIVEGDSVYFVYKGEVLFGIGVAGDMNNWDTRSHPMESIPMTDLHYLRCQFPSNARIEYKFVKDGAWIVDPLNLKTCTGEIGLNSFLTMPEYSEPPQYALQGTHRGRSCSHSFESDLLRTRVDLGVHFPAPAVDAETCSLLCVLDGEKFKRYAQVDLVCHLHNAQEETEKVILALIDFEHSRDLKESRLISRMIIEEVLPFIGSSYPVDKKLSARALLGASFLGVIPFLTVLESPGAFGKVGCMSGYLGRSGGAIIQDFLSRSRLELKVYMSCGTFETNIGGAGSFIDSARLMHEALMSRGYDVLYEESPEGHSWFSRRARLISLFRFFFSGSKAL